MTETLSKFEKVLQKLQNSDLRANREKSNFLVKEVEYLGHKSI